MKYLSTGVVVLLLLYGLVHLAVSGWHYETGHGEHTGYVTAVETNGLLFKTDRAYVKTDTQSSQEDKYCVLNSAVTEQLRKYSAKKAHITVSFVSFLVAGAKYCKGEDAIITSVRED